MEIKKINLLLLKKQKYITKKKISSKAPVATVQISNISKNKENENKSKLDKIFIHIGTFYSSETAKFLRGRIIKDITDFGNLN